MRMLDNLKEVLDDIAADDEWAHQFVEDLLIKREEAAVAKRQFKLSPKQFNKLVDIHERWCA